MSRLTTPLLATLLAAGIFTAAPASAQFEDASVRAFHAADQNGDEALSFSEFRVFIQDLTSVGAPVATRIQRLGAYRIAFGRIDRNGDGVASPSELRAAEMG